MAAKSRQAEEHGLETVVATGTDEVLIAEAAAFLGMECTRIPERYGAGISDVFPAYAVARLTEMEGLKMQRSPDFTKDWMAVLE